MERNLSRRSAAEIQARYYATTRSDYDRMHVAEDDEHYEALGHISALIGSLKLRSILDVGSGTGRALTYFRDRHPEFELRGVEPVSELIDLAVEHHGVPADAIQLGSGERLPFEDGTFDAVTEFAVLHHVPDPAAVVREMTRVARRAVFLSDTNRFGYGSYASRLLKLGLWKCGAWRSADWLRNGGKRYRVTEDDGLFYSYSVYDSYSLLADWADRVLLIPTRPATRVSLLHPLLTTTHILLCAVRDEE